MTDYRFKIGMFLQMTGLPYLPPNGSGANAMRINFANLKPLIEQVEAGG